MKDPTAAVRRARWRKAHPEKHADRQRAARARLKAVAQTGKVGLPMIPKELIDKIGQGRRAATLVLQRLDLGLDPASVVKELVPTLSPIAAEASARLAGSCSFDFALLSLVLAGLAPDSLIQAAEFPEASERLTRQTPDEIKGDWLLPGISAPMAPEDPRP